MKLIKVFFICVFLVTSGLAHTEQMYGEERDKSIHLEKLALITNQVHYLKLQVQKLRSEGFKLLNYRQLEADLSAIQTGLDNQLRNSNLGVREQISINGDYSNKEAWGE
ncbi:RAQPRD family integrative conjugative element protein [Hahella ganghwensis]|uniref:RAQPRD family integrative conjugative element protein n=1 Tax=Hahella ganghwensis TaxID=286420 RepID=UPI000378233E|nr:RAQPRD family integrative conjugative element protein [Hahella ganghwensis]